MELPPPNTKVLAFQECNGNLFPVIAVYIPKFFKEDVGDDNTGFDLICDYCEETDVYYWAEGWYEHVLNWDDFAFVAMPKPFFWQEITYPLSPNEQVEKAFNALFDHVETLIQEKKIK